jgi:hypothetical protein
MTKINLNLFDTDEQILLNAWSQNYYTVPRDEIMRMLNFVIAIQTGDVKELCDRLKEKLCALSDEEWVDVAAALPFDVPYSDRDNVSETDDVVA